MAGYRAPRGRGASETHATIVEQPSFNTMNTTSVNNYASDTASFMSVNESVASWMTNTAITKLREWSIIPKGHNSHRVRIVGMDDKFSLDDSQQSKITTGVVAFRRQRRLVETTSGSVYQLIGLCCERRMVNAGYSPNLIKAFSHGFPEGWLGFLQDDQGRREAIENLAKKGIKIPGVTDRATPMHLELNGARCGDISSLAAPSSTMDRTLFKMPLPVPQKSTQSSTVSGKNPVRSSIQKTPVLPVLEDHEPFSDEIPYIAPAPHFKKPTVPAAEPANFECSILLSRVPGITIATQTSPLEKKKTQPPKRRRKIGDLADIADVPQQTPQVQAKPLRRDSRPLEVRDTVNTSHYALRERDPNVSYYYPQISSSPKRKKKPAKENDDDYQADAAVPTRKPQKAQTKSTTKQKVSVPRQNVGWAKKTVQKPAKQPVESEQSAASSTLVVKKAPTKGSRKRHNGELAVPVSPPKRQRVREDSIVPIVPRRGAAKKTDEEAVVLKKPRVPPTKPAHRNTRLAAAQAPLPSDKESPEPPSKSRRPVAGRKPKMPSKQPAAEPSRNPKSSRQPAKQGRGKNPSAVGAPSRVQGQKGARQPGKTITAPPPEKEAAGKPRGRPRKRKSMSVDAVPESRRPSPKPVAEGKATRSRLITVPVTPKPVVAATKRRNVKWFNEAVEAVTRVPTAKKVAFRNILFDPTSSADREKGMGLPEADWSDHSLDLDFEDFQARTYTDPTATFRLSAGRPLHPRSSKKNAFIPSNTQDASDRLNFQGFLDQEKRGKVKNPRPRKENTSSMWSFRRPEVPSVSINMPKLPGEEPEEPGSRQSTDDDE